jgi:hypothetical protein
MSNSAHYAPSPEYLSCVEREEEMACHRAEYTAML